MKATASKDIEYDCGIFVLDAKGPVEALLVAQRTFSKETEGAKPKHMREMYFQKCLDCKTYWTEAYDDECGECGEPRLSKKYKRGYYLNTNLIN